MSLIDVFKFRPFEKEGQKRPIKEKKAEEAKMETILNSAENNVVFYQKKLSPLEEILKKDDIGRLISFAEDAISKTTPEELSKTLSDALPHASSIEAVDILISCGAIISREAAWRIAGNILKKLKSKKVNTDTLIFFRANKDNGLSMNYTYQKDPLNHSADQSLYDLAESKEDWIELAENDEINQEFISAISSQNHSKAEKLFDVAEACGKRIDLDATDEEGLTAMSHARNEKDIMFLYRNGAELYKEDSHGLNPFERVSPEIQEKLVLECLKRDDIMGLAAAVKAGIPLNNVSYLEETKNPRVLAFLVSRGASIDDAILNLKKSNKFPWSLKRKKGQISVLQLTKEVIATRKQDMQKMTPEQIKEIEHEFRQSVVNKNQKKVLKMLTKYAGILNVDAQSSEGYTALMYAARANDISMITLLTQFGASTSIKNNKGKNFFSYATPLAGNKFLAKYIDEGNIEGLKAITAADYPVSASFIERAKITNKESYNYFARLKNNILLVAAGNNKTK